MGTLIRTGQSRSSPSLVTAAAFNLREFSLSRKKIPDPNNPEPLRKVASYEQIDLIGGNGKWRKMRAVEDFERRRIEEEELRRQERLREAEREQRRKERRELRRKAREEEETKRREEEERKLQERLERERVRQEQQERERLRKLEEERERQRRMPVTCTTCLGSGICQVCCGKGFMFATYLVSTVNSDSLQQYGKCMQGCASCGGCKQGIRGELKKGVGKCAECSGYGKIWPNLDEILSPKSSMSPKARMTQAFSTAPLN